MLLTATLLKRPLRGRILWSGRSRSQRYADTRCLRRTPTLTYRVRRRHLRFDAPPDAISLPAAVTVEVHLLPEQPFGGAKSKGRTITRGSKAGVLFDANSGAYHIDCDPIPPLDVAFKSENTRMHLTGRILTVSDTVTSLQELDDLLNTLYFAVPALLGVSFGDPPYVERIAGKLGGHPFRWELADWRFPFRVTESAHQARLVTEALSRIAILAVPTHRRLFAAVHYFYIARRLLVSGNAPGEFLAETILNLAKVLDCLFPSSQDAARAGLSALGYSSTQIEARFIPAIVLRNNIDVGHVGLALFRHDQLSVLHEYAEGAERHFGELLSRVLESAAAGSFSPPPAEAEPAGADKVRIVDKIKAAMAADAAA